MSDNHNHDHGAEAAQPPPRRQPPSDLIIRNQAAELNRINDNRIYLLAMIDDFQADLNAAAVENAALKERVEHLEAELAKGTVAEEADAVPEAVAAE